MTAKLIVELPPETTVVELCRFLAQSRLHVRYIHTGSDTTRIVTESIESAIAARGMVANFNGAIIEECEQ